MNDPLIVKKPTQELVATDHGIDTRTWRRHDGEQSYRLVVPAVRVSQRLEFGAAQLRHSLEAQHSVGELLTLAE